MFSFSSVAPATIRPFLLLGAAPHEADYALLRRMGVTHILQIGSELRPSFPDRFQYLRLSVDDAEQEDLIGLLPRCFAFLEAALEQGRQQQQQFEADGGSEPPPSPPVVLVHCMAGMSRSASVVLAYLMAAEGLTYTAAFKQVKAARPCIYPNLGFLLQLWEWEDSGRDTEGWPGWNKHRFAERLAAYRRAQAAAGLHPAVRVRLPMERPGAATDCDTDSQAAGGVVAGSSDAAMPARTAAVASTAMQRQTEHPAGHSTPVPAAAALTRSANTVATPSTATAVATAMAACSWVDAPLPLPAAGGQVGLDAEFDVEAGCGGGAAVGDEGVLAAAVPPPVVRPLVEAVVGMEAVTC